jgi:hypothetical protein
MRQNRIHVPGKGEKSTGFLSIWPAAGDARIEICHNGDLSSIEVGKSRVMVGTSHHRFNVDVGDLGSGVRKPVSVEEWERNLPQCAPGEDPILASIEQDGGAS